MLLNGSQYPLRVPDDRLVITAENMIPYFGPWTTDILFQKYGRPFTLSDIEQARWEMNQGVSEIISVGEVMQKLYEKGYSAKRAEQVAFELIWMFSEPMGGIEPYVFVDFADHSNPYDDIERFCKSERLCEFGEIDVSCRRCFIIDSLQDLFDKTRRYHEQLQQEKFEQAA